MRSAVLVVVALGAVGPLVAAAQESSRDVYVTVLDRDGTPLVGLTPQHFAVREEGRDRDVLAVTPLEVPMHVALLLDTSANVGSGLPVLQAAAASFVDAVGQGSRIALYTFGDRALPVVPFTGDPSAVKDAIRQLFVRTGPTRLIDAVEMAARDLRAEEAPRPVIVAVTTTDSDVSTKSAGSVIKLLMANGTPLHTVAVKATAGSAGTVARGTESSFNQSRERMAQLSSVGDGVRELTQLLDQGASLSGGSLDRIASLEAAGPGLVRVTLRLRSAYLLTYASTIAANRRPKDLQVGVFADGVAVRATLAPSKPR